MVATWDTQIKVINASEKLVSVSATRTDGEDIQIYNINNVIVDTYQQKLDVIDLIWDKFQESLTKTSNENAIVSALEIQANSALNNKEIE